jgi:hypothetical protein
MGKALIGKEWRVGIQEEAAFKTAIADNAAFKEIVCDFMPIKSDLKYRNNDNVNTGARFQDASGVDVDSVGSMPSCTIKGTAIKDDLDYFLYAVMQYVSEGASTPFVKTFTFPATAEPYYLLASAGSIDFSEVCRRDLQKAGVIDFANGQRWLAAI